MNAERPAGREQIYFNGINGDTGEYDLPPMTGEELAGFITGQSPPENLNELRARKRSPRDFGPVEGVDPKALDQAGWAIIFAHNADPAIKEALSPLIELRAKQAEERFWIYQGADGYRPGEKKTAFLARHGAGPGPVDPEKVPYYLLIVGSPEVIPYEFQYQLDVQYAVGRIHFNTLQEYANYAASVVAAEEGQVRLARRAAFFGVANQGDRATQMSSEQLVRPLFDKLAPAYPGWTMDAVLGPDATKKRLTGLLGDQETPALFFSASHGMGFPLGSPRQLAHQGALLCGDWPGPQQWRGAIPQDHYFAGDDLGAEAKVGGMIAFFFACYGAGTPLLDDFARQSFKQRSAIAPYPFLGRLPVSLLGHPRGGALAVIGHIERAWGYSFNWPNAGRQTAVFESTLRQLLSGYPVGEALGFFNERYAELASDLNTVLEDASFGGKPDPYEVAGLWTANNDARDYTIVGDPAVRLPLVAEGSSTAAYAPIQPIVIAGVPNVDARPEPTLSGLSSQTSAARPPQAQAVAELASSQAGGAGNPASISMTPLPTIPDDYKEKNPELYKAWVEHIKKGYKNNDEVFRRVFNALMRSHNSTVLMYWTLFVVGIGFFVAAGVFAFVRNQPVPAAVFGGLSVAAFLSYFVTRPTQAVEENLQYITWLGVIYNSYWTRLAWSFDERTAAASLEKATDDATTQLNALVDRYAESVSKRPGLLNKPAGQE